MPRLQMYFLGPPRVELDGEPVSISRHKALALLAYLAVTGRRHRRDALATLFSPEHDQSRARAELRRALAALRAALGEGWADGGHPLDTDRESVALNPEADFWVDVQAFQEELAQVRAHGHARGETCPECLNALTEAADLYQDDFLAGFTLKDSPAFDDWQFFETQGLRDEMAWALERLARIHAESGEYEQAVGYARRWVALDRLHEPAQRTLMWLYASSGQRASALRQYAECQRVLEEELGVPPDEETVALYEGIRAGEIETPTLQPIKSAPEAEGSVRVPAFLDAAALALDTPAPIFVARERELARLDGFLRAALAGQGQVVFITGGPGRGKTALMDAFARRMLAAHPDLLVASGNCNAYSGVGDPYLPFRDVLGMPATSRPNGQQAPSHASTRDDYGWRLRWLLKRSLSTDDR
jgi:DNA-binding SARP family transcriptional activator